MVYIAIMYELLESTYFDTPTLPNVLVREISGRMQARSLRCCGCRIQSSQNLCNNHQ